MDIFDDFFGSPNMENDYIYPKAGINASPYVKKAISNKRDNKNGNY